MSIAEAISRLNEAQQQAVTTSAPQVLVLAGAGSGKTRVLVHRIAWCLEQGLAAPSGILGVTFTNKAAAEMRGRIEGLLGRPLGGMWVGTFHGIAHRLLRAHWREARLPEQFQIMDAEDQARVLKRVIRGLNLDEDQWPVKESQWFINARKDEGLRPDELDDGNDLGVKTLIDIYRAYEDACARAGLVDFGELLLRGYELWRDNPGLLRHYRERFFHVLVDEFQDTNALQYRWLKLLVAEQANFFVVGDDDQSIYSWRGAQIENMQRFRRDFPSHALIRLEQNYRSTGTILDAANALISNNTGRLGKKLWTDGQRGEAIRLFSAFNDVEEARYCVDRIRRLHEEGDRFTENAILYRVSAQSRVLEDALRQADVPYRVHGGFKFYERAEIKDALGYLRLACFRDADPAFERVVNLPVRGIGNRTVDEIRNTARLERISLWAAAQRLLAARELPSRAATALTAFVRLIESLAERIDGLALDSVIETVIETSGLVEHYRKEKGERGLDRIENLAELVAAARDFEPDENDAELPLVAAFLSHAALEAGEGQAGEYEDCVQLMTLHAAKGLEFTNVFLVGMEEGLFPHQRSANDPGQLEEERRLCYVGLTRARRRLTLSHAECRRLHGADFYPQASRFLREVPRELLDEVRTGAVTLASPVLQQETGGFGLQLGQRVLHRTFGEGVVLHLEGRGAHTRVQVNFAGGVKWLVAAYAGLEAL
ncbi:MAG: DNA helicase II [Gammaproteobacteria bacterium]